MKAMILASRARSPSYVSFIMPGVQKKTEFFVVNMTLSKGAWGGSRGLWGPLSQPGLPEPLGWG